MKWLTKNALPLVVGLLAGLLAAGTLPEGLRNVVQALLGVLVPTPVAGN